jgi:hypothetical protein
MEARLARNPRLGKPMRRLLKLALGRLSSGFDVALQQQRIIFDFRRES